MAPIEDEDDDGIDGGWGPAPSVRLRTRSRNLAAIVLGVAAFLIAEWFVTTPSAIVVGASATLVAWVLWPLVAVTPTRISAFGGGGVGLVAFVAAYVPGLPLAVVLFKAMEGLLEPGANGTDDIDIVELVGKAFVYTAHLTLPLGIALGVALAVGTRMLAAREKGRR